VSAAHIGKGSSERRLLRVISAKIDNPVYNLFAKPEASIRETARTGALDALVSESHMVMTERHL